MLLLFVLDAFTEQAALGDGDMVVDGEELLLYATVALLLLFVLDAFTEEAFGGAMTSWGSQKT